MAATVNHLDIIIERLYTILEGEFKRKIKIFKMDRPDFSHDSISFTESLNNNEMTWAPDIVVDRFNIDIALRKKWQKDENKKEEFNLDYHRIKDSIIRNRRDTTTGWFNGFIVDDDAIEIEYDENDKPKFWKRIMHFSCLMAYNFSAVSEETPIITEVGREQIITEDFDELVEE